METAMINPEAHYADMIEDARRRIATMTSELWVKSDAVPEITADVVQRLKDDIAKFESVLEALSANRT
jgi:hypothetical protein